MFWVDYHKSSKEGVRTALRQPANELEMQFLPMLYRWPSLDAQASWSILHGHLLHLKE